MIPRRSYLPNQFKYSGFNGCHEHIREYLTVKDAFEELEKHISCSKLHDLDDMSLNENSINDVDYLVKMQVDTQIQKDKLLECNSIIEIQQKKLQDNELYIQSQDIKINEQQIKIQEIEAKNEEQFLVIQMQDTKIQEQHLNIQIIREIMELDCDNVSKLEKLCGVLHICPNICLDNFVII
jgi:hypothetical protein